jgi:hypothetical protein
MACAARGNASPTATVTALMTRFSTRPWPRQSSTCPARDVFPGRAHRSPRSGPPPRKSATSHPASKPRASTQPLSLHRQQESVKCSTRSYPATVAGCQLTGDPNRPLRDSCACHAERCDLRAVARAAGTLPGRTDSAFRALAEENATASPDVVDHVNHAWPCACGHICSGDSRTIFGMSALRGIMYEAADPLAFPGLAILLRRGRLRLKRRGRAGLPGAGFWPSPR